MLVQDGEFSPFTYLQPMTCTYGTYSQAGDTATTSWTNMCTFCAPGALCESGETDDYGTNLCPLGHYCNAKDEFSASYSILRCPTGTYALTSTTGLATMEDACEPCPAGSYCDGVDIFDCPEGYYCPG